VPVRPSPLPLGSALLGLLAVLSGLLPGVVLAAQADSAASAFAIGPDGRFVGTLSPQSGLWYHVAYTGGAPITVTVAYEPATANRVDFFVYTGDASQPRQETDTPTRANNSLSLTWSDPSPRDLFVRVVNNATDTSASFVGTIAPTGQISAPAGPTSPASAPAAATPRDAVTVPSDGSLLGTIGPRQAVWYRFWYANPGAQATIQASFAPSGGSPDLNVYTGADLANLTQQSGSPTVSADTLQRVVSLPSEQWVYFTLVNNNDGSPLAYTGSVAPVGTPPTRVNPAPSIRLEPTSAAVGGTLTVRGSGWTPGAQVVARLYQQDDTLGPGADLGGAVQVAQDGTFSLQGSVPRTLFGSGNRGNVDVRPGSYTVVVRQGTDLAATAPLSVVPVVSAPAVPHDARYFAETRYRIDNDAIWGYFQARGGIETFGYPVSRTFVFLGCTTQIFQRQVAQVCADGQPRLINLLDPEIFPYTRVNGSTFPAVDDSLKAATPKVGDPTYATTILDFVRANAPDVFGNLPVNFGRAFFGTVSPQMAGTSDPNILGLLDLEVWGAPISRPMADPSNPSFIYQRFQRGILHYDASTGVTHGILLADYLKSILTGQNVPADLQQQASESRFYAQYAPGQAGWVARPAELPGTDLAFAFEQG
jgi:hypothetical protein